MRNSVPCLPLSIILVTKWTQLHAPSLQSMFVTEWVVVTLQVGIPFCEMHLCRKLCFLPYQWEALPYSPTSIIMPRNATLPRHYPTLTIVEPKGLRPRKIFPLRSTYNDENITLFPITSHMETPLWKYLALWKGNCIPSTQEGFVYKVYVWEKIECCKLH